MNSGLYMTDGWKGGVEKQELLVTSSKGNHERARVCVLRLTQE